MLEARKKAGPATRRVLTVRGAARAQSGTAVAIHPRMVLTCRHVLEAVDASEEVRLEGGCDGDMGGLKWHRNEDPFLDVALGVLPSGTPDLENWLDPQPADPADWSQPVHCIGFQNMGGALKSWREHVVAPDYAFHLVHVQNSIHKGCSGGPVLDNEGRLVGLVVSRDRDAVDKHVLPIQNIYRWIEDQGWRRVLQADDNIEPSRTIVTTISVPIGPPVQLHQIPEAIIDAFAETFPDETPARAHIARSNQLARETHTDTHSDREIMLRRLDQPGFDRPSSFWTEVFTLFGSKSRRSVAALLAAEGAPNPEVHGELAFQQFWKFLSNP